MATSARPPRPLGRRYFVVVESAPMPPYIVAETAREPEDEGEDRQLSLAGCVGGAAAHILTEPELQLSVWGAEALALWRAGDDDAFHDAEGPLEQAPGFPPILRLVPELSEPPAGGAPQGASS